MIDLSTEYMGLRLRSPLVCSSSPLTESLVNVRRMEDAGAGAIVMHSLFEEQIELESLGLDNLLTCTADGYAEALSYFPDMTIYNTGPEGYLDHLRRARDAVEIPVIASLNGKSVGGWVKYARLMQEAGADALELNIYHVPTRADLTAAEVEKIYLDVVSAVRAELTIPLGVKIGAQFSSPANFARKLEEAGARGLVLFNRFYQPDFNLRTMEIEPGLHLSDSSELLQRLHWVAILFGQVNLDLAVTGGVHTGLDVLKCMMAGGKAAMLTSALLKHGIEYLEPLRDEILRWMEEHEYESIRQMQGSMSLRFAANPEAFERANYMRVLRTYARE